MINGVHLLLSSSNPGANRAFFRDVLGFAHLDAGEGWLIFVLPPTEMGIHPAEKKLTQTHVSQALATSTIYLMCDNLRETLESLAAKGVEHTEIQDAGWGEASSIALPGGANLGLYEPRHRLATTLSALRSEQHAPSPSKI